MTAYPGIVAVRDGQTLAANRDDLPASATDTSPRSAYNTTCSLRSGVLFEGLAIMSGSPRIRPNLDLSKIS